MKLLFVLGSGGHTARGMILSNQVDCDKYYIVDVLISTGSGLTLPPFLMARLFGFNTIFIESPSRVYRPSIAGRLLIGKVDLWLSSWPDLAERYEGVEYRGMIF